MLAISRVSIFIFCLLTVLTPNGLSQRQTEAYAFNVSAAANLDPVSVLDAIKPSGTVDRQIHFVPNSYEFWTNPAHATTHLTLGCTGTNCSCASGPDCTAIPAFGDILLQPTNFVWCKGGPYALCYYSGPNTGSLDLSCTLTPDGRYANCNCFEVPWGAYFVDMNAILNYEVYRKTVKVCGADGRRCAGPINVNRAPVCKAINQKTLIPGADAISAFSLDCAKTNGFGLTGCGQALYAGCMTAPCKQTGTEGVVQCSCPTYNGQYQVGSILSDPQTQCTLGGDLVWSAAFNPGGTTTPPLSQCVPDAPGGNGCPLFNDTMSAPPGTDCRTICKAYSCKGEGGIESAYTCDATLCTGQCSDRSLLSTACSGLSKCPAAGLLAIAKLEAAVGCSCCASQLCKCDPNDNSNDEIFDLNAQQRQLGITPQCDVNNTLCGTPSAASTNP
jgi:hypothetical protein